MFLKPASFALRWAAGAAAGLLLVSPGVHAADSSDHLNVPGTPRPELRPPKPKEGFVLPPIETAPAPQVPQVQALETITIERVVFRGNTVFSTEELEAIAAPYSGRTIGASELEQLRQKLTRHYVDRGYINSGVVVAPDSADKVVVFEVLEGRLSALRLRGMERLDEGYVARRLVKPGDGPFNIDLVRERFQLLLNDPLFERMNARLTPGTNAGEAFLDIDVVRARPYQLTAFFNNYRPPSIGSESVGLSGWVRNLTGYGDFLEANVQTSPDERSSGRGGAAWRMPLGYHGTQFSIAFDHGRSSVVEEPVNVLNIKSTLDTRDVGLSQLLFENLEHKLAAGLNRVRRENRTTLLGEPFSFIPGEPTGITKETLWRLWQEYTYRSQTYVVALRSTFTRGKNNLQEVAGLPPLSTPEPRFDIWLGQGVYARQVLENGAQIVFRGTVQHTKDKLLPLDGISIGGVHTVRGYRENQLVRDVGEILNVEFEYPLVRNGDSGVTVLITPFYDRGRGKNRGDAPTTLSSWGLAGRLRWNGLTIDVAVARRLEHPEFTVTKKTWQDKGVHFQLSYAVF